MEVRMLDGGQVRVSEESPRWNDWRGKQAYKFFIAAQRAQRAREAQEATAAPAS